jgi:hypothetical protein
MLRLGAARLPRPRPAACSSEPRAWPPDATAARQSARHPAPGAAVRATCHTDCPPASPTVQPGPLLARSATRCDRTADGKATWFSSQPATNSTSASSASSSAPTASSRHRCRPSGQGSHHPSSVSTALYPRATNARTTLDFPVPDIPVRSTRFTSRQPTTPNRLHRQRGADPTIRWPRAHRISAGHVIPSAVRLPMTSGRTVCRKTSRARSLFRSCAGRETLEPRQTTNDGSSR